MASLILCNTFTDTSVFNNHESAAMFWILPALVLKRMLMANFSSGKADIEIIEAIDFMVERVYIVFVLILHISLIIYIFRLKVFHKQN